MKATLFLSGLILASLLTTSVASRPVVKDKKFATLTTMTKSKVHQCNFLYKECRYEAKEDCKSDSNCYVKRLDGCQRAFKQCQSIDSRTSPQDSQ